MSKRVLKFCKPKSTYGENIHFGGSNNDGMEIVISLIIDDDVPSRGHRTNIYKKEFGTVGIAFGPHKRYGEQTTMDFADACEGPADGFEKYLKEIQGLKVKPP